MVKNKAARAAEVWDEIERELISVGITPDRWTKSRAAMIRMIGQAMRGMREKPEVELRTGKPLGPMWSKHMDDLNKTYRAIIPDLPPAQRPRARVQVARSELSQAENALMEKINSRLDQLIERSIHGYSGDEEVPF